MRGSARGGNRRGRRSGENDLLIAAQAVALGDVIVTDNEREFGRIEGLAVENWLRGRDVAGG